MTIQPAEPSRTVRKVTVSLSALQFQANLHSTVVDQDDPVVGVCTNGHPATRIRRVDSCPSCASTDKDSWGKAQEIGDSLAVLDAAGLEAIKAADNAFKGVVDLQVVEAASTALVPTGTSYYLAPQGPGAGNYHLIAAVVRKKPKVAFIAELSFGAAPKLFRLELAEGGLVLREIARPEAIRERPQVPDGRVDPVALKLAMELADARTVAFKPEDYINRHARSVAELIEKAPAVTAATSPAAAGGGGGGGDLIAQLKASVEAARAAKTAATTATAAKTPRTTKRAAKKVA